MQDLMPPEERAQARADFLRRSGHASATLQPLPVDASLRRYFRLAGSRPPLLLMDAPPPGEDVRPFVRIARHLAGLGLSPPAIFEIDEDRGFLLIEDFGEGTFTRLMDSGADPAPLFAAAADALAVLHTHPAGANVAAPAYDHRKLLDEVGELPDWYGPAMGTPPAAEPREAFMAAWETLLHALPPPDSALVLLDFHVDNLMWLPGRPGAKACGLLDFQDARIGPSPYDPMTLLRNERRGIDPGLSEQLLNRYVAAVAPADPEAFGVWYRVLAAQRYAKVLGRFARLTLRDGRDGYLRYLPRVAALLSGALADDPVLRPVRLTLDAMLPRWRVPPPDDPAAVRRRVALSAGRP